MPNLIQWDADPGVGTQIITNEEPANDAGILSSEVTPGLDTKLQLALHYQVGTAPNADGVFRIYKVLNVNGTYEWGDASNEPAGTKLIATMVPHPSTTGSVVRIHVDDIDIGPEPFKIVVWNATGQTIATNTLQLYAYTYTPEIQ